MKRIYHQLYYLFLVLPCLLLFIAACRYSNSVSKAEQIPSLIEEPITIPVETKKGYHLNAFSHDTVQIVVNAFGDTVLTGTSYDITGKLTLPEHVKPPHSVSAGRPKIQQAYSNIFFLDGHVKEIPFDENYIRRFVTDQETEHFVLTNTIGDTIPSGIPIPVKEIKKRCLFPETIKAKPLADRDDAVYNIQTLSADQGLLNPNLNALLADSRGNLWIGMYGGGLTRYDGSSLMILSNYTQLVNNYITDILEDKQGNLWVTTDGGVCCFDGEFMTSFTLGNGLTNLYTNCITEDRHGNIWFGTQEKGVSCYTPSNSGNPATLTHYSTKEGISENFITAILEDKKGNLWFGSKTNGITIMEPEDKGNPVKVTYMTHQTGLPDDKILDIMEDKAGNIWIGTARGGCCLNRPMAGHFQTITQFYFNAGKNEYPVQKIYEDGEGNIWFATLGAGAIKLIQNSTGVNTNTMFTHFTKNDGLPNNRITSVQEDKSGNIWLGTNGGGACIIKSSPIIHYGEKEGLSEFLIHSFYEDVNGNIWFGTKGDGLIMFRPFIKKPGGEFIHYTSEMGLPENIITSVSGDEQGNIWMGTNDSGLCKFDGKRFTTFTTNSGLCSNEVKSVMIDHKRNVWAGTSNGFSFLPMEKSIANNKPEFVNYTEKEGLLENFINTIYEDRDGKIWIGSKRGISQFELSPTNHSGRIIHFTEKEGLPFWNVIAALEDQEGNMWIGTGRGLICYNTSNDSLPGTFTRYAPRGVQTKGINHTIRAIQSDPQGNIWFGSEGGINQLIQQKDSIPSYRYRQFTEADGLKGNTVLANSMLFDRQHRAWWGNTFGGAEMINLDRSKMAQVIPQPAMKGLEINERFIDFRSSPDSLRTGIDFDSVPTFENYPVGLKLSYRNNNLSFHFTAVDWSAPHKVRYSFHMKGLNNTWSQPSNETKAEFRGLPYGKYSLQLRAYGESQQWSSIVEYPFRITPPWWYSWWAYVLYGLIGSTLIYSSYRFQLVRKLESNEKKRLVELDVIKNRLYGNIAHEFRTPLTLIHGPVSQALSSDTPIPKRDIQSIYKQSERLQQLINQMLDLQKLEAGKLKPNFELGNIIQLLRYLVYSFEVWAGEKNITLSFSADPQEVFMDYDQEKLTQIISNLVSNAIKHTPRSGKVSMSITTSSDETMLNIQIQDTGAGISEEDLPFIFERFYQSKRAATGGSGIGLALTQNLVELLGGTINVQSTLDIGSTFKVALPITQKALKSTGDPAQVESLLSTSNDDEIQFSNSETDAKGKPIILIIEDHPEIAQYVATCLASEYATVMASNGNDGLRMAYEHIPDLIVSDVMMPGKDGFELTGILKTDIQTSHIPIILLTGRGDHDAFMSGLERGADAYVTKPFDPPELLLRIKKLLELRANLSLYYRNQTTTIDTEIRERISPKENEFMKQLRSVVEEHINDAQFNMNMLSKRMAMSHPQLHRKITALTGESTGKFVRSVRLTKAKDLLKNSDLTISEIAYETGFSEPGYFTKTFSKEYNMTPTEYRASMSQ